MYQTNRLRNVSRSTGNLDKHWGTEEDRLWYFTGTEPMYLMSLACQLLMRNFDKFVLYRLVELHYKLMILFCLYFYYWYDIVLDSDMDFLQVNSEIEFSHVYSVVEFGQFI